MLKCPDKATILTCPLNEGDSWTHDVQVSMRGISLSSEMLRGQREDRKEGEDLAWAAFPVSDVSG